MKDTKISPKKQLKKQKKWNIIKTKDKKGAYGGIKKYVTM